MTQKLRIAVITPYYKEPLEFLIQCHQSVIGQVVDADVDHFLVADGFPQEELEKCDIKHIILPIAHADFGNTPRGIGSILAAAEGYDFITYLDADNWFHADHLASLFDLWKSTNADVCCSFTTIHLLDGTEIIGLQSSDEKALTHVDTSCYFLSKKAFKTFNIWLDMPRQLTEIGDRIFFSGLKHFNYSVAFSKRKTVAYRSQYKVHYLAAKLIPPEGAKENVGKESYKWLLTVDGVKETVKKIGFFPL